MNQKIVGFLLLLMPLMHADPVITFFFRDYPTVDYAQYMLQKMTKPHGIAKRSLEGLLNHNRIAGIFSTYYGFLNVSDQSGQTLFPRKQSKGTITIVISNKITPIMMFKSTVSHWQLVPGTPAAFYTCDLKEDEETKLQIWNVTKIATPENNIIPATESLVIIAKPHNVYLPVGASLSSQDANLLLPTMYIKKGIHSTRNALYMLNLTFLFRPVDLLFKREKKRYGVMVAE